MFASASVTSSAHTPGFKASPVSSRDTTGTHSHIVNIRYSRPIAAGKVVIIIIVVRVTAARTSATSFILFGVLFVSIVVVPVVVKSTIVVYRRIRRAPLIGVFTWGRRRRQGRWCPLVGRVAEMNNHRSAIETKTARASLRHRLLLGVVLRDMLMMLLQLRQLVDLWETALSHLVYRPRFSGPAYGIHFLVIW